jgi:hypothetical protein
VFVGIQILQASAVLVGAVYGPDEKTACKASLKELRVKPVDQNRRYGGRHGVPGCDGLRWVGENERDKPWQPEPHGCECGAGAPCPACIQPKGRGQPWIGMKRRFTNRIWLAAVQTVGVARPFSPSLPRSSPKDRCALLIGPPIGPRRRSSHAL